MDDRKIGIFDSGLGGLTVLYEVMKILPNENIIYIGDNKNSPYGDKSQKEIVETSKKIIDFLKEKNCKIILIACNTASIAWMKEIKEKNSEVPVLGVVEPTIEILKEIRNKNIGVFATKFTINSKVYSSFKESKNKYLEVECPKLCPMIEEGWENFDDREEILKKYFKELREKEEDVDLLLLGCTHYPLIKQDIKKIFKGKIINPAKIVAQKLLKEIERLNLKVESTTEGEIEIYFTLNEKTYNKNFSKKFKKIKAKKITIGD